MLYSIRMAKKWGRINFIINRCISQFSLLLVVNTQFQFDVSFKSTSFHKPESVFVNESKLPILACSENILKFWQAFVLACCGWGGKRIMYWKYFTCLIKEALLRLHQGRVYHLPLILCLPWTPSEIKTGYFSGIGMANYDRSCIFLRVLMAETMARTDTWLNLFREVENFFADNGMKSGRKTGLLWKPFTNDEMIDMGQETMVKKLSM